VPLPYEDFISVKRAETEYKIHIDTLLSYIKDGLLPAYFIDQETDRYIRVKSISKSGGTYKLRLNNLYEGGSTGTFSNIVFAITFPIAFIFIKPNEFMALEKRKSAAVNIDKELIEHRITPYNVKGRKGTLKAMVFDGLQAFYTQKKQLPTKGRGFQDFLNFIQQQSISKPRPEYLELISKVKTSGTDNSICLTITDKRKRITKKTRKYVSTQFYKFLKEFEKDFLPQVASEEASLP